MNLVMLVAEVSRGWGPNLPKGPETGRVSQTCVCNSLAGER